MWGFTECRTVSHLLWNYSANRLPADERELVERHLTTCDACRAEADAYRQAVDGLASMRRESIPQSRRGWRELQTRLSEPQVRAAASRAWWSMPPLAWGSFVAVLGAVAFMYFSKTLDTRMSIEPSAPTNAGGAADQSAGNTAPDAHDPFNLDDTYIDTSPDPVAGPHASVGRRVRRAQVTASNINSSQHAYRHSVRLADARLSPGRSLAGSVHGPRVAASQLDPRHLDGAGAVPSNEARDYVLAPVSTTSDSETGADYVMGSVMMNSRSVETEEARGL
jgi:hypothetical protein